MFQQPSELESRERTSMNFPNIRALATTLGLFVAVYAPAFAAVSLIRPAAQVAVPVIISISLAIAFVLIFMLARRTGSVSEFGLSIPKFRYVGLAVLLGLPLAFAAGWLGHFFPSKSPIDTSGFPLWMLWLYFGLGAAVQEEVIFRGLLQIVFGAAMGDFIGIQGFTVACCFVHSDSVRHYPPGEWPHCCHRGNRARPCWW
jgi:membrane protease YdiL (CAAX protease family)